MAASSKKAYGDGEGNGDGDGDGYDDGDGDGDTHIFFSTSMKVEK